MVAKTKKALAGAVPATVKVTQIKSVIGRIASHRACVIGLGLRRISQTVEV